MISSQKRRALRDAVIALIVAAILTFYGLLNFWQGIEAPNTRSHVLAFVLLLPIAALSTLFRSISSDGHLSQFSYRLVLVIGSVGQFLYYYLFVLALDRVALVVFRSRTEQTAEDLPAKDVL